MMPKHLILLTEEEYENYKQSNEIIKALMEKVKANEPQITFSNFQGQAINFTNYKTEDTSSEALIWFHEQLGFEISEGQTLDELLKENSFIVMKREKYDRLQSFEHILDKVKENMFESGRVLKFFFNKIFKGTNFKDWNNVKKE